MFDMIYLLTALGCHPVAEMMFEFFILLLVVYRYFGGPIFKDQAAEWRLCPWRWHR